MKNNLLPKDKKILIIGVSGTIGHAVALEAAKSNEVWGVSRFSNEKVLNCLQKAGVHCVKGNLVDWQPDIIREALDTLPDYFDIVIDESKHSAFITPALYEKFENAKAFIVTTTGQNYIGYTEECRNYHNGERIFRWDETLRQPLSYFGKYGMDKAAIEYFATHYSFQKKIPTSILRYECPVVTNNMHTDWLDNIIRHIVKEKKEVPVPRGIAGRPFNWIDVRDAAIATLESSTVGSIPPNIFNLAGYIPYTIRETCEMIGEVFTCPVKFREIIVCSSLAYGGHQDLPSDIRFFHGGYNHPFEYVMDKMKENFSAPKIEFRQILEEKKSRLNSQKTF